MGTLGRLTSGTQRAGTIGHVSVTGWRRARVLVLRVTRVCRYRLPAGGTSRDVTVSQAGAWSKARGAGRAGSHVDSRPT